MSMTPAKATDLRKPFPAESIGKLPKGGQMLDFVGHAAVTDRLLTIDPEWTWDFALHRADGTPVLDDGSGNLWISLTVCGVTRKGVGDGKSAKERIGDAIRNAAMRFGVALDLWAKENLVEFAQASRQAERPADPPSHEPPTQPADSITAQQLKKMGAAMREAGITERDVALMYVSDVIGRPVASRNDLTKSEAGAVIDALEKDTRPQDGAA